MGSWNISIHGVGSHHNKQHPEDANRMAAEFVELLRKAGHTVTHATITHGAEDIVTGGIEYLHAMDEWEKR